MPKPLDAAMVKAFATGFAQFPVLKERGFSILINVSSKLYVQKKLSLKDVDGNLEDRGSQKSLGSKLVLIVKNTYHSY